MSTLPCRRRPVFTAAALLVVLLTSSGCGGLIPKPPERQIYRLDAAFAFTGAALPHVPAQLAVATPTALDGLDTRRIALTRTPVTLDYYADAEWTDQAPFLVRDALVQGFEKSGAIAAVGPESLGLHADYLLTTEVRDFEAVYDSPNGAPHVRVVLNLDLVRMPERKILAETVVRGEAAAAANKLPDIVAAFGAALSQAAQGAVVWTVTNPALSPHSGAITSRTRSVR